jgi:hypothetical protein
MAMRLKSNDGEIAVFASDPADPTIPDEEIRRSATSLSWETFRSIGSKRPTKAEFETQIEAQTFPDPTDELSGVLGTSNRNMGFGLAQTQPGAQNASQVKAQIAREAEKKK